MTGFELVQLASFVFNFLSNSASSQDACVENHPPKESFNVVAFMNALPPDPVKEVSRFRNVPSGVCNRLDEKEMGDARAHYQAWGGYRPITDFCYIIDKYKAKPHS